MNKQEIFEDANQQTSAEEDNYFMDEDICTLQEIERCFDYKYKINDEIAVSLRENYILNLCSDSLFSCVAAGLSDGSVQVFSLSEQRGLVSSTQPADVPIVNENGTTSVNVCGLHFLDDSANHLLVGTTNGLVRLFDLRTNKEESRFDMKSNFNVNGISCFDRNANGRIICAGTEQIHNNVYLLFYDIRKTEQMGGYFLSHENDITAVNFHDTNPDMLCTGSTDGLINIFNISETSEEDALITTINSESSVYKLNWQNNGIISCITHTNDFKAYDSEEGNLVVQFDRPVITNIMKRKAPENINLINSHSMLNGDVLLLAGTNSKKGELMRSLRLQNKHFVPFADFHGNKQIVRESLFDNKWNSFITAGESAIISVWIPMTSEYQVNNNIGKLKRKTFKTKKGLPY